MTYEVMTGMINLEDLEVEATAVAEVIGGTLVGLSMCGCSMCCHSHSGGSVGVTIWHGQNK